MDNKVITTPNGYIVTLKSDLTFGEYEDIQNSMTQNIKLDPATGKPTSIDMSVLGETNKKARELMIISITKDGVDAGKDIRNLPRKDGAYIQKAIDEITKDTISDQEEQQKKGI